jgi:hypothetical protein
LFSAAFLFLPQNKLGQNLLDFVDVNGLVEFFLDAWDGFAGYPDFQFGVEVEGAACLNTEPAD